MSDNIEFDVTWEDVDKFCLDLKTFMRENDMKVNGVYAPPRGGLCIAVIMSHELGIPMLMNPCHDCLVVDDIADEGKTLLHIAETYDCVIATIGYSKQSVVEPTFWSIEKQGNKWFKFPWER